MDKIVSVALRVDEKLNHRCRIRLCEVPQGQYQELRIQGRELLWKIGCLCQKDKQALHMGEQNKGPLEQRPMGKQRASPQPEVTEQRGLSGMSRVSASSTLDHREPQMMSFR